SSKAFALPELIDLRPLIQLPYKVATLLFQKTIDDFKHVNQKSIDIRDEYDTNTRLGTSAESSTGTDLGLVMDQMTSSLIVATASEVESRPRHVIIISKSRESFNDDTQSTADVYIPYTWKGNNYWSQVDEALTRADAALR